MLFSSFAIFPLVVVRKWHRSWMVIIPISLWIAVRTIPTFLLRRTISGTGDGSLSHVPRQRWDREPSPVPHRYCPTIMDSVVPGQVGRGTVPCPTKSDADRLLNLLLMTKNLPIHGPLLFLLPAPYACDIRPTRCVGNFSQLFQNDFARLIRLFLQL